MVNPCSKSCCYAGISRPRRLRANSTSTRTRWPLAYGQACTKQHDGRYLGTPGRLGNSNSFEPPLLQRPRMAPGEKQQLASPPGQAARCHLPVQRWHSKAERRGGLPWQVKRELNMLRRQQRGNSFASANNTWGRLSRKAESPPRFSAPLFLPQGDAASLKNRGQ